MPRVLICNGYGSNITGDFIKFCLKKNIQLLIILPHVSHFFLLLDLATFGPLNTLLSGKQIQVAKLGM
jgi:hypothetical protein